MKRILTTIQEKANNILLFTILAGAITSCDSILDYNENCDIEYCVKFKYDYSCAQFKQKQRKVNMREMNCKWLRMSNIS